MHWKALDSLGGWRSLWGCGGTTTLCSNACCHSPILLLRGKDVLRGVGVPTSTATHCSQPDLAQHPTPCSLTHLLAPARAQGSGGSQRGQELTSSVTDSANKL